METQTLTIDREEAIKMWRKYQSHRHHQTPVDADIERIYAAIAKGKLVIRALESIRVAGLGADNLPKLAIVRADAKECHLEMKGEGAAQMSDDQWVMARTARSRYVEFPVGSFTPTSIIGKRYHVAIVPHIPPDIRPKRGLENYHILFEAIWRPEPPRDPLLLRRMGKGDVWLVCGAWDLTEVERGVMADHMAAARRQ
jgi:hypothetical protein